MPALFFMSYTAPQITEHDLQNELVSMPAAQARAVELEKRGLQAIRRETPELWRKGLQDLQQALQDMPSRDKDDYTRAMQICPDLVQSESDSAVFLRCEDFNGKAAAVRLTNYWKMRSNIFQERAFLPLTQTGNDALIEDDIALLRDGLIQILPSDPAGRAVIYYRRVPVTRNATSALRALFYALAVASSDHIAQRHGLVLIVDCMPHSHDTYERKLAQRWIQTLRDCAPIALRTMHVCFPRGKCVARLFYPIVLWLLGSDMRRRLCTHVASNPEEFCTLLAPYIMPTGLPCELGGTRNKNDLEQSLNQQLAIELARNVLDSKQLGLQVVVSQVQHERLKLGSAVAEC